MRWTKPLLLFLLCLNGAAATAQQWLHRGWTFRTSNSTTWHQAEVPGALQQDLVRLGLMPEPLTGLAEPLWLRWEDSGTIYQCTFLLDDSLRRSDSLFVCFEGLDTYAMVALNGHMLHTCDNMFRRWEFNITEYVQRDVPNVLTVTFHPAAGTAKALKAASVIRLPENERIFVRKAQFQFGWDFGPRLLTQGVWRPVCIRSTRWTPPAAQRPDVRLVQRTDSAGRSFGFEVHGRPVYIKGVNWIPADVLLPRSAARYRPLLCAAKEAGVNMIRVWGGGVYEDDLFYDLCDSLGLMVWQDFMFACAMYPGDEAFLENAHAEVRDQVLRLRRHPCIVLWCGNNEIEEGWFNWGWQQALHYSASDSIQVWQDYRRLFHEIIPEVLQECDPGRPYWPSSPGIGWGRDSAYTHGDVHYWGVWWGREPVSRYREKTGRFVSEYGMQAYPDHATRDSFGALQHSWADTASDAMTMHQKHPFGLSNLLLYTSALFKVPAAFDDFAYLTQLMQADAIGTAIRAHRSRSPFNQGTMYWQLNDCWPGVTWSSIDYYGRKKALHYRLRTLYAPVLADVQRTGNSLQATVVADTGIAGPVQVVLTAFGTGSKPLWRRTSAAVPCTPMHPAVVSFPVSDTQAIRRIAAIRVEVIGQDKTLAVDWYVPNLPTDMRLPDPHIRWSIQGNNLRLHARTFAYGVHIRLPEGVEISDNYLHLAPGHTDLTLSRHLTPDELRAIRIQSLYDCYPHSP